MSQTKQKSEDHAEIIVSIFLNTRGFGYACMDNGELVYAGITTAKASKPKQILAKVEACIDFYEPDVLILQALDKKDKRIFTIS